MSSEELKGQDGRIIILPDSNLSMNLNVRFRSPSTDSIPEKGSSLNMNSDTISPCQTSESTPVMVSGAVFPSKPPDWCNLKVIHRNIIDPRSYYFLYETEKDALTRDIGKAKVQVLSGTWKFNLAKNPFQGPIDFFKTDFDSSGWDDIAVPGMWQCQGFGKGPQYTNINYPWPVDPPHIPFDDNECGRYRTTFTVQKELADHQQRLRFEGVDSSFTVWVNGQDVGYSQGSRNPSEFDITSFIKFGEENSLCVEVYQRCDGSYIEDQDQLWLSGIFRDVYLHSFPKIHPVDFHVHTLLDAHFEDATLKVDVRMSHDSHVSLKLVDADGKVVAKETEKFTPHGSFKIKVKHPYKWTAEVPYLYNLILDFGGECFTTQRVGFRQTNLINGIFCINGKPVKFRGVNRHEHHPESGRTVPFEWLKADLLLMKAHNINGVRTSHYINDPRLYDLADELGLWILDEADLECHGMGVIGGDAASYCSNNADWEAAYVDRARQMVMRDKNHPCIIMWSLGNEAFYGKNHQAMYDCIKKLDQSRLIHYEGDYWANTADIYSRMYTSAEEITRFATEKKWKKPLVMCEYVHAMGNGPGAIQEYVQAFYDHPRLMGGFVWEWANHGLKMKNSEGKEFYAYGGDWGDHPNDGHFCMDGLCNSDHTPTPGLIEYRKAIEPVQTICLIGDELTIVNRYDFLDLDHLRCYWILIDEEGQSAETEVQIPKGVKPHSKAKISIKGLPTKLKTETWVRVSFRLRDATAWAEKGTEVAYDQHQLGPARTLAELQGPLPEAVDAPTVQEATPGILAITSPDGSSIWNIDMTLGTLTSWKKSAFPGEELMTEPITIDFYRALTDNDAGGRFGHNWRNRRLHETKHHVRQIRWEIQRAGLIVEVLGRVAPPVLAWGADTNVKYTFSTHGVCIRARICPRGPLLPETFARIGLTLGLKNVDRVRWFGRGPGESYCDKKMAQSIGTWDSQVDDLFFDYEFPQDSGNRTDIRWVEFVGKKEENGKPERLMRARFGDLDGASFSALHYTTKDLDEAMHPFELHKRKREDTIVKLDWVHHGLGTGSCGPATLPAYELKTNRVFDFEVLLD